MKESIYKNLERIEGMNTIDMIQKKLKVSRKTAIKKISVLRKLGFVDTSGGGKQPRIYSISRIRVKKMGYPGLYDIINKNSPVKLIKPYEYRIIDKRLSIEEAIVRAVKTEKFRVILASLALFNKIKNWSRLYEYAKQNDVRKKVGALYDVAKVVIRVRRMDKKTRNLLLGAEEKEKYIIKGAKSKDFIDIEKKWKVHVPFDRSDLMRLKE